MPPELPGTTFGGDSPNEGNACPHLESQPAAILAQEEEEAPVSSQQPTSDTVGRRRQSRKDLLIEAMQKCDSTRAAMRFIKERDPLTWATCYNMWTRPLNSHYEDIARDAHAQLLEDLPAGARHRQFTMDDFSTPLAAELLAAWQNAMAADKPFWIHGVPGAGKTEWVRALLGNSAFRMGHTHNIEMFRWWTHPYLWADDVNWKNWDIEDIKNFFERVSAPRRLGVRYTNLEIPESCLKGIIVTSNHRPDYYFSTTTSIDISAIDRRLHYFFVGEQLFDDSVVSRSDESHVPSEAGEQVPIGSDGEHVATPVTEDSPGSLSSYEELFGFSQNSDDGSAVLELSQTPASESSERNDAL